MIEITKSYWFSRKARSHFFVDSKSINKVHKVLQKHPFKQFEQINTIFFHPIFALVTGCINSRSNFNSNFAKSKKKCFVRQKKSRKNVLEKNDKSFLLVFLNTYLLRWVGTLVYCKLISKTKLAKLNFESPSTVLQLLLINFCIVSFVQWFIWKKCFSCLTVIELNYENSTI